VSQPQGTSIACFVGVCSDTARFNALLFSVVSAEIPKYLGSSL
jgi:hypothetical protein